PPADLANHIGAEFKLRLMNGKLEKGKLLAADNEWVKLKIRFGAGDIARKIKLTDIKSAVKIIELKTKLVE
ncbi:MAG: hypothetical protein GY757_09390, partial [bacterium]|nr:hypothetical protein [bacterium]